MTSLDLYPQNRECRSKDAAQLESVPWPWIQPHSYKLKSASFSVQSNGFGVKTGNCSNYSYSRSSSTMHLEPVDLSHRGFRAHIWRTHREPLMIGSTFWSCPGGFPRFREVACGLCEPWVGVGKALEGKGIGKALLVFTKTGSASLTPPEGASGCTWRSYWMLPMNSIVWRVQYPQGAGNESSVDTKVQPAP